MFDIEGYEPAWQSGASNLWNAHSAQLGQLVGRRLSACWSVWDASDDTWFADAPVVLDFDGCHVEISHHKFDELDVAWNRIDLSRPITWRYDDGPMPLNWREDRTPDLDRFRGEVLTGVGLLEWIGRDVAQGMVAVAFQFANGCFQVSNGLDENQIDVGPPDPRYRQVRPRTSA